MGVRIRGDLSALEQRQSVKNATMRERREYLREQRKIGDRVEAKERARREHRERVKV